MHNVCYGNLLDHVTEGVIIHQVNAQGVMHRGFAGALRLRYPKVWDDYTLQIKAKPTAYEAFNRLGTVIFTDVTPSLQVISIVCQQYYGYTMPDQPDAPRYTSYDALDRSLKLVGDNIRGRSCALSSQQGPGIHYPLIGSDRGGARWPIVSAILDYRLKGLDQTLWLLPGSTEPT